MQHTLNGIGHFDVTGPQLARLVAFYGDVFGWKINAKGPGYALVETPEGGPNGALIEGADAALTLGIVVPDLALALQVAVQAGGKIIMPEMDNGWVRKAQVTDPAGNLLTLIAA